MLTADSAPMSVRELLTELAHLEDAERQANARTVDGAAGSMPPSPELDALLARQDRIIAALHSRSE